jgi:hypothetical protein
MTENDFYEYVEAICKRPKMYTPTGSFYEVVSFLEGFGAAGIEGPHCYHSVFTPFCKWIVTKFSLNDEIVDWKQIRALFASDSEALNQLPILYKEYLEQSQKAVS